MNKIEKLIKEFCPDGVEWKKLGEVANCFSGGTPKTGNSNFYDGEIPWIRSGEINFNVITKSERNITKEGLEKSSAKMIRKNSVVLAMTGATVGRSAVIEFDTSSNQSVAAIETNNEIINYKYLYYFLAREYSNLKKLGQGALTSLNLSIIKNIKVPIPSIETQEKIVKILDNFTKCVTELQEKLQIELNSRIKHYNYYRDMLLSEDYLNKISKKIYEIEENRTLALVPIKEVCIRQRGFNITAGKMKEIHKENAPIKIFAGGKTVANIDESDIDKKYIIEKPSIIVKSRGNIDFEFYDKPFSHKNELWSYSSKNNDILNIKYLYYYLKKNIKYFEDKSISGKLPQISTGVTDNYKVFIPSIIIQNKIVKILDRFQELLSDTKGLLPLEIEQRRKQYEYYREKLLTFESEEVYALRTEQNSDK